MVRVKSILVSGSTDSGHQLWMEATRLELLSVDSNTSSQITRDN